MFFADPTAALHNIGAALKPGGRLVFACWASLAGTGSFPNQQRLPGFFIGAAADDRLGPTARLIEEKNPDEETRQTIAHEIAAAFAAEAASRPIWLAATIFLVAARRPH
jgi:SAM-dependent methyltransferase